MRANTTRKGACGQVDFLLKKLSSSCAPKKIRRSREKQEVLKYMVFIDVYARRRLIQRPCQSL